MMAQPKSIIEKWLPTSSLINDTTLVEPPTVSLLYAYIMSQGNRAAGTLLEPYSQLNQNIQYASNVQVLVQIV